MSRARGIVPLVLATILGVGNGIWVFGPAFKEEREQKYLKEKESRQPVQNSGNVKQHEIKVLRDAEAAASKSTATEAASRLGGSSGSWVPKLSLWTGADAGGNSKSGNETISHAGRTEDNEESGSK